jgi:RNA polymerase sigma factor (TIGR02999 family)
VYVELRRMARVYMHKERVGNTLQATALVNEVFLRLVELDSVSWQDRAHFFAVSATMMWRILVDRARGKGMAKRGGGAFHLNLDDVPEVGSDTRDREINTSFCMGCPRHGRRLVGISSDSASNSPSRSSPRSQVER